MKKLIKPLRLSAIILFGLIKISFGYIGPGPGLSTLAAFLAVVAGLATAIFGLFWYPLKRLFGKNKKSQEPDPDEDEEE